MSKVKIEQDCSHPILHKVYIDGEEIDKIFDLQFHAGPLEIPKVTIKTCRHFEFEGEADVEIIHRNSFKESCRVIKNELENSSEFYDAFCACIKSAIIEHKGKNTLNDMDPDDLSKNILNRIIGLE